MIALLLQLTLRDPKLLNGVSIGTSLIHLGAWRGEDMVIVVCNGEMPDTRLKLQESKL